MLNYYLSTHLQVHSHTHKYTNMTAAFLRIPPLLFCSFHASLAQTTIQNLGLVMTTQCYIGSKNRSNICLMPAARPISSTKKYQHMCLQSPLPPAQSGSKCSLECWDAYKKWVYCSCNPEICLVGDQLMSCQASFYRQRKNSHSRTTSTKMATPIHLLQASPLHTLPSSNGNPHDEEL